MVEIQLSSDFRKNAIKSILSILLFILTYLLLFIAALGLIWACAWIGIHIIMIKAMFYTLILGLGLILMSLVVFFFLIKFLFKSKGNTINHLIQVKKKDEPELFEMIAELAEETGAPKPAKVFLSNEVNAYVFYNSTYLSLFLPVKKNLVIGLGLLNSCTKNELRSILAHEFGHFSQKSMRIGSYVYTVNSVIYNLLFEESSVDNLQDNYGNSSVVVLVAVLSKFFIGSIRWVLRKVYLILNYYYYALSREMEFNADEVSVRVCGTEAFTSSLLRIEFASHCYQEAINELFRLKNSKQLPESIYQFHRSIMDYQAKHYNYAFSNGLPQITLHEIGKYNKSKLQLAQLWSTHPPIEKRIERIQQLNIPQSPDKSGMAYEILRNFESWENQFVVKVFYDGVEPKNFERIPNLEMLKNYDENFNRWAYPLVFNNYFNFRSVQEVNTKDINHQLTFSPGLFNELFSDESVGIVVERNSLEEDISTLKSLLKEEDPIKYIVYDSVKYHTLNDLPLLIPKLLNRQTELDSIIRGKDQHIFNVFCALFRLYDNSYWIIERYEKIQKIYSENTVINDRINDLIKAGNFIYEQNQVETIIRKMKVFKAEENKVKEILKDLLKEADYISILDNEELELINSYQANELIYFANNNYDSNNLNKLNTIVQVLSNSLGKYYVIALKNLLEEVNTIYQSFNEV